MTEPSEPLADRLARGARALGLADDAARDRRLLDYLALLARWNRAYNLTAVRDPAAMVTRHLLDALALVPHLAGDTLADLGSGAGLPGVPLAIADPARRVALVEANAKKARFLREVVRQLGLERVRVIEARAERTEPPWRSRIVTARALAALPQLVRLAAPWLAADGELLAMKGPDHADEIAALPPGWHVLRRERLHVPDLDADRWLVVVKPDPAPGSASPA